MPSGTVGMFAPSATRMTPPFTRLSASLALISSWVALGKAQSAGTLQSPLSLPATAGWYVDRGNLLRVLADPAPALVLERT